MDEVAKYAQGSEPLYASLGLLISAFDHTSFRCPNSQGKGGAPFFCSNTLEAPGKLKRVREKQYQGDGVPQDLATGKSSLFKNGSVSRWCAL